MSITRAIAHNTAIQIIGKVISTLLGLASIAIMTHTLGVEKFGWYVTATGFLQFIGIIGDFGFTVIVSNMLSEPDFPQQKVLNTAFTWRLITALVLQGLAPIIFLFFPYPAPVKLAVFITTFSFFAIALNNVLLAHYRTALKMGVAMTGEVLSRAALLIGIALVAFFGAGFLPIMLVISLASIVGTAYLFFKIGTIRLEISGPVSRVMFTKMWPTALSVIFNAFYLQGDRVILPLYVSQSDVGLYGASYRVLDVVIQVSAMVMGIIMPLITYSWSRGLREEFRDRYQMGFNLLALILLPMVAGIVVLATPIMRFFGPDFASGGYVLRGISISIVGICFGTVFGHVALAINRQKQTLWVYVTDAILSVIGYFIFIPRYGIMGAIGVTIFSEMYAGLCLALITIYYSGVRPRLFTFFKIVLASSAMGWVVYTLQPLPLLASIFIGMIAYGVLAFVLRIISIPMVKEVLRSRTPEVAPPSQI